MNKKKAHVGKLLAVLLLLVGGAAAGFGYFTQSTNLREDSEAVAEQMQTPPEPNAPIFAVRENDIVIGNAEAPVTIIEYMSLSCPHCAHFNAAILPKLKAAYIDNGKAKLVVRHFPLNEPALKAAMLVECAGGDKRLPFIKTLFENQKAWAFTDSFANELATIGKVGGMDSAAMGSCLGDKSMETAILQGRQDAATIAQVTSTPSFFVNGIKLQGGIDLDAFKKAIAQAQSK